jgi:hypothetical protein
VQKSGKHVVHNSHGGLRRSLRHTLTHPTCLFVSFAPISPLSACTADFPPLPSIRIISSRPTCKRLLSVIAQEVEIPSDSFSSAVTTSSEKKRKICCACSARSSFLADMRHEPFLPGIPPWHDPRPNKTPNNIPRRGD